MENAEERYRNLCSLETLRSGKRGFFGDFSERVTNHVGDRWISKVFARFANDEDRIRAVFADAKIAEVALETLNRTDLLYRGKDANASRTSRLEGFVSATAAKRREALSRFSQAVLRAPLPGKDEKVDRGFGLPLALLARAEILLAENEHVLALQDLRYAEELGLPDEFRLVSSRERYFKVPRAEFRSFCLFRSELARKKETCERSMRENENSLISAKELERRRGWTSVESKPLPRLAAGENPRLPGASSLLEIEETDDAGKRAIAAKEIVPGDALVVEAPLGAVLLPDFFGTHCHHCFSRFVAPVGCPDCSGVAFCGIRCRDAAISSYHKYECKILALLIGSGMSVLSMLALRMVTQNGPRKCSEIWTALTGRDVDEREDKTAASKQSKSAKRRSRKKKWRDSRREQNIREGDGVDQRAYDLVTHEKQRTAKDFLERSLMAAFLLRCLQRVGFFERTSNDAETPNEREIAVAALLSRHLQLLQFNAHEVFETRHGTEHRFRGSKPVYLGVAVYPTVARFNHDCYPAVTRYFVGRSIVVRAIRRLRPGDVVAENYGPIFTKIPLKKRRDTLAGRYWFRCECTACREDWPLFDGLTNDLVRFRCPTESCEKLHGQPADPSTAVVLCSGCRREVDLRGPLESVRECERLYARGFAAMDEERPEAALREFLEGTDKFHRVAVPPHRDTHLAEIAASICMADQGNVWSQPNQTL
nr:PREDICTED: SET and MYND domain-containing protein 4 isoform X2 [Megachile rotundata]